MNLIVNQDGIVYQRNLGEMTARMAARIKEYAPDSHWSVVQEAGITNLTANLQIEKIR